MRVGVVELAEGRQSAAGACQLSFADRSVAIMSQVIAEIPEGNSRPQGKRGDLVEETLGILD